ncbi:hypothetical protein I4U23_004389 [Adineta vaga]|nr:hypothetical protein I4U23_004389 [Adineta vaga]
MIRRILLQSFLQWIVLIGVFVCGAILTAVLYADRNRSACYSLRSTKDQMDFLHALDYEDTQTVEAAFSNMITTQLEPYFGVPSYNTDEQQPGQGYFRITQDSLNAMEFIGANTNLGVRIRIVQRGKHLLYRQLTRVPYRYLNQRLATFMQILGEMIVEGYFDDWKSTADGVDFILILHGPCSALHSHAIAHGLPVFTFMTSDFHSDLLLPDTMQFGSHGTYRWPNNSHLVSWKQKKELALFRGKADCYNFHSNNWFSCTRVKAVKLSMMNSDVMDIGITEFNHLDWDIPPFVYGKRKKRQGLNDHPPTTEEIEAQTNITRVPFMSFEEQSAYKYILDIDGSAGSARKGHIIGSGSVFFSQKSIWKRWLDPLLIPYIHYVPIDINLQDLRKKVLWARQNDEHMQRIVQSGIHFQGKYLSRSAAKLYIKLILNRYKQLLVDHVTTANVTTNYCSLKDYMTLTKQIMNGPLTCSQKWLVWSTKKILKE